MKLAEIKKSVATILNQEKVNGEYLRHWHQDLLTKLEITELRSTASWQKILNHLEMTDIDETIEIAEPVEYESCSIDEHNQEQLTEVDNKIAELKAAIAAKQQALAVVRGQLAQHQGQLEYTIERVKNWEPNPEYVPCKAMVVYEPVTVTAEEPVIIDEEEQFLLFAAVVFIVVLAIMSIGFIPMCVSALIYKYREFLSDKGTKIAYDVYNTVKQGYKLAVDMWELSQMTINLV